MKTAILGSFELWGFCTQPYLLMRVKFGVLEYTYRVHLHASFISIGLFYCSWLVQP